MANDYKICTKCIMDTTDPDIHFDGNGVCNHCHSYEKRAQKELYYKKDGEQRLNQLVDEIKNKGRNKEYNCIIGLSGGTDSSMVAYLVVKKLGLKPYAIHLDNEWNAEVSESNIENICNTLGIDLHKYVVNWEEFKDLQLSFLKASIPNAEIPTDHAIVAFLYKTAVKKGIQYIITGSNVVTEATSMSLSWGYDMKDLRYIKGIHKRFGESKIKSLPKLSLRKLAYYILVKKIKYLPILNYVPYNKEEAIKLLEKELDWKYYGGKHYESIYTRFFQCYILPKKFNIDKRKAHFSTLICSGQMTREEALQEMKKDTYPSELLEEDKKHVIKKLGLTEEEFETIMSQPIKSFRDYPNSYFLVEKLQPFVKLARRMTTYRRKDASITNK